MTNSANTTISHDARLTLLDDGAVRPTAISDVPVGREIGFLGEDGETLSNSKTVENYRARNNNAQIVRSAVRDGENTFSVTALEDTALVRSLYWGSEEDENGVLHSNANNALEGVFVYDAFDTQAGYTKGKRYVFKGIVTPNGDITYSPTTLTGYPLLITVIGDLTIISQPDAVDPVVDPEV